MVFHNVNSYSTTPTRREPHRTFLYGNYIDPYIRKFVSRLRHSRHRHFIDPRHIGCTIHLWTAFGVWHSADSRYGRSLPPFSSVQNRLCRASDPPAFAWNASRSSGQAFQGVTPSFHLSDCQFSLLFFRSGLFLAPHGLTPIRVFPDGMVFVQEQVALTLVSTPSRRFCISRTASSVGTGITSMDSMSVRFSSVSSLIMESLI